MMIKPAKLEKGDVIGVVAPASAPLDSKAVGRAVDAIEQLGFRVRLAPNVHKRQGFLAGTDRERAGDLMRMFKDRKVKAIICVRGGYGTSRLLPLLDYKTIKAFPKIFVGHSDITSLHLAFLKEAGLISFHGPMLHSDFANKDMPDFTRRSFLRILTSGEPPGSILRGCRNGAPKIHRRGKTTGRLVGGNLTLVCASLGTPWQPSLKGAIFFFEDLAEPPYRFDRMLTQLLNSGMFNGVAGIAVGTCKDCEDPGRRATREYRQTLDDVLRERLLPLKVPLVSGLPFGHIPHNATLPVGSSALLDADKGDLIIHEPAVT